MREVLPAPDDDGHGQLLHENEQLRKMLAAALEENSRLVDYRDEVLHRVSAFVAELRSGSGPPVDAAPTVAYVERKCRAQVEEELRLAFEQLHALTEELETANNALHAANANLEERVLERTQELGNRSADLRKSESAFRTIANLVPDLLWQTDGVGKVVWFNDLWHSYVGAGMLEAEDDISSFGINFLNSVHPDDREDLLSAWHNSVHARASYQRESRIRGADGNYRWFLVRAQPIFDDGGGVLQWFGAATDVHDQRTTLEALQHAERWLSILVEGVWQLVWRAVGRGEWTWSSPQWTSYTGQSETESHGRGWLQAVHPDDRAKAEAAWAKAEAKSGFDVQVRIYHAGEGRYRHFRSRAAPVTDREGRVVEWLGTSTDVDDIIQLQQQQTVLVAELQHRTRNLLGVVESIVRRTITGSTSLEGFQSGIIDRLSTLARVQGLLSRRLSGALVPFDALVREELSAHVVFGEDGNGPQVSISGPENIRLFPSALQTLALALHELATNAVKYGALSIPEGHLNVSWSYSTLDRQPSVRVAWKEHGVPNMPGKDEAPKGGGFGRELIERALPYQLGARTSYAFEEDGVHCTIELPIAPENPQ